MISNLYKYLVCNQLRLFLAVILCTVVLFPSCNITKFLGEDEHLIDQVNIKVNSSEKQADVSDLKEELKKFISVEPNKNGRSRNYYKYKDQEKLSWVNRWLYNKHSQPPSLLDTFRIEDDVITLQNYLRNKKGFYQAKVDYEVSKISDRIAGVEYQVTTGDRYHINKLYHISKDSSLIEPLDEIAKSSLLKSSDPIDAFTFDIEKQRIVSAFQKRGYADFNLTNVEIKGDSSDLVNAWDIFFMIIPPSTYPNHQKFSIGDINVYTDSHQSQSERDVSTEYKFGKYYKHQSQDFIVKPSTIDRKIFLKKYETYDSEKYNKSVRSLFSLGTYRFAKLSPRINAADSSLIDYNVYLTPHNNKWSMDTGLEAFYSNISINVNNLVGMAANVGLEDKNAFGGAEKFKSSLEAGVEINPSNFQLNTLVLGLNNVLEIPSLTKPLNILRPLHKLGAINDSKFQRLQEEGKSNLSLGFNFIQNLNLYSRFSVTAGYGYDFILNSKHRLTFNQIGVSYNIYNFEQPFNVILMSDPVLRNSFQNSLFTGFLFNDLTHYYNSERGRNRSNIALISRLELSGLEVSALNSLSNAITGGTQDWTVAGIEFERLAKLEFDFRWYQKARKRSQLAARINTGIAIPLDDRPVAFIKQFSVGGPSSLRSWRPMHVGPGGFLNDGIEFFEPGDSTIFFQRGDILIEANLEYRFDLIWLMEGALFVDAGNVWTLRDDPRRPRSKFGADFLSEMAIGYGYGLRFDFSYFIIRFDLGFKLRFPSIIDPATNAPVINDATGMPYTTSRWVGPRGQKFGNFNIGVNYPF